MLDTWAFEVVPKNGETDKLMANQIATNLDPRKTLKTLEVSLTTQERRNPELKGGLHTGQYVAATAKGSNWTSCSRFNTMLGYNKEQDDKAHGLHDDAQDCYLAMV